MSDLSWITGLLQTIGPVATVLFLLLIFVLFGYRRDFLMKDLLTKEERDRMTAIVARDAAAAEKLAESVARFSEITRETADRYTRQIEDMIRLAERRRAGTGRGRAR